MVCIDKATAVRMYDKVQAHWLAEMARLKSALVPAQGDEREALLARIHLMASTDMAVVVSQGQNEVEDLAKKGLDIVPHRQRMIKEDLAEMFKAPESPLLLPIPSSAAFSRAISAFQCACTLSYIRTAVALSMQTIIALPR